jgi:hypothetical protein
MAVQVDAAMLEPEVGIAVQPEVEEDQPLQLGPTG